MKKKTVPHTVSEKLSMRATSNLPSILYIRDMEYTTQLGMPNWQGHPIVDQHAEVNQQIEVGVYQLVNIVHVNAVVNVTINTVTHDMT